MRSLLSHSWAYQSFWHAVGGARRNRILLRDYIRPAGGDRILDLGCGPGSMVPYLDCAEYVGLDASAEYIDRARRAFRMCDSYARASAGLIWSNATTSTLSSPSACSTTWTTTRPLTLFQIARDTMKPGGRLVTIDGVWTDDQSPVVKYLLARDRGRFVRSEAGYRDLASKVFSKIESSIRHDLLRIPYTVLILRCSR